MELKGKTALVTGAGIRLGRAFSIALAKEGVNIIAHYNQSAESAEETAHQVESLGVRAVVLGADFNDPESVENLIPEANQFFDQVQILINNAAIYLPGSGLETDRETWECQFRVNLQAPFLLIQSFARQLPSDQQGRIVNISDAQIIKNKIDHFAYQLTKTALVKMTRMFALELAPNITVNAIGLGIMLPLAGKDVDLEAYAEKKVPLLKTGNPEIAAHNALHLIKSEFTTGAFLRIDGGQYL